MPLSFGDSVKEASSSVFAECYIQITLSTIIDDCVFNALNLTIIIGSILKDGYVLVWIYIILWKTRWISSMLKVKLFSQNRMLES